MAVVTLKDIRKVYAGGVEAVKGVSFDVPDGAFCVLVGPSGCGKSTLLRMVAGLETISSGTVTIGSRVVNDIEPADRDIAMVFQNYALYPHMSVYDNMAYGLRNRKTPPAEIEARVQEAARILAIEPFLKRRPRELSGGQRQRVAMGRAIVRKPQVFLFDEPLSNLDAKLRVQMRVEIKKLQRALGVTALYVTHDQIEAMTLSDVLVVMNGGVVEQIGAAADIYRKPATIFVATFIGSPPMNILPGVIAGPGKVSVAGHVLAVADLPSDIRIGDACDVGLRPEDLHHASDSKTGIRVDIDFVEELGATQLFHGRIAGAGEHDHQDRNKQGLVDELGAIAADSVVVQANTGLIASNVSSLTLVAAPEKVHVFHAETGRRLGG
jgi:sn-glycerol 3-phosphate transport system ATP-binding protein